MKQIIQNYLKVLKTGTNRPTFVGQQIQTKLNRHAGLRRHLFLRG